MYDRLINGFNAVTIYRDAVLDFCMINQVFPQLFSILSTSSRSRLFTIFLAYTSKFVIPLVACLAHAIYNGGWLL